jgi:hypothetical protein
MRGMNVSDQRKSAKEGGVMSDAIMVARLLECGSCERLQRAHGCYTLFWSPQ